MELGPQMSARKQLAPDAAPPAPQADAPLVRFGLFQLDAAAGQLLKNGRVVPIKPQPMKLLQALVARPGEVVTREEIRHLLWGTGTFVDFEQGVNTAVKGVREALGDDADRPLYLETVPRRGYRFIAPVEIPGTSPVVPELPRTDLNLHKALWLNIAELRLAEVRRKELRRRAVIGAAAAAAALASAFLFYLFRS